jgi:hypothetical protein
MTTSPPSQDFREPDIPRWVQIPIGIILALFTLFCAFATVSIFFLTRNKNPNPIVVAFVLLVLLIPCLWVLGKCFRLITGRKKHGGLLGPAVFRIVAYCL